VLASPRQQVVEDVKGPFLLGLADSTRLLQKIFADIKEQHKLGGKAFPLPPSYPHQKEPNVTRKKKWHKMVNQSKSKLPGFHPSSRVALKVQLAPLRI
jgi:hypothetical protein